MKWEMALRRSSINYLIPPSGNLKFLLKKTTSCLSWNGVGNLISPWVYKGKRTSTTTSATTLFEDLPTHTCLVVILVQGEEKGLLIDDLKALS